MLISCFISCFSLSSCVVSTDVQDFNVQVDGTMVTVTCILATGSVAKGCVVQLLFEAKNITRNIMRQDGNSSIARGSLPIVGVVYNEFEVRVFDYEDDSSVGSLYWSAVVMYVSPSSSITTGEL